MRQDVAIYTVAREETAEALKNYNIQHYEAEQQLQIDVKLNVKPIFTGSLCLKLLWKSSFSLF